MARDAAKEKSLLLMIAGKSDLEIVAETKLPMGVVTRQRGFFNSPSGKLWASNHGGRPLAQQGGPAVQQPAVVQQPSTPSTQQVQQPSAGQGGGQGLYGPNSAGEPTVLGDGLQQQLLVAGAPLIRKVMLNPKLFFWYDYAVSKIGFKGDIGDFVFDCVEDYFASRGYTVVVEKKEVTPIL